MKRAIKDNLKQMKIFGFKWDKDPFELYDECKSGNETDTMTISKRDMFMIFRYQMLQRYNHKQLAEKYRDTVYGG